MSKKTKHFSMAGLDFSVCSQIDYNLGIAEEHFSFSPNEKNDTQFEIISEDFHHNGKKIYNAGVYCVFEDDNNYYREFTNKLGVFVLKREKGNPYKASLYGNGDELKLQQERLLQSYFGLEVPLLYNHTFILHSSLIRINDSAVVFTAPSQVGKSTQAELWKTYKNADILNGDRTCIRVSENEVLGCGSLFAGSSGIYRNECAPIKAIVVLEQAKENRLEKLSYGNAFTRLYSQTLTNPWDKNFVQRLIEELEKTISLVPVYKLSCRPDFQAVELLYNELFK